jgi:hypothetical protein
LPVSDPENSKIPKKKISFLYTFVKDQIKRLPVEGGLPARPRDIVAALRIGST